MEDSIIRIQTFGMDLVLDWRKAMVAMGNRGHMGEELHILASTRFSRKQLGHRMKMQAPRSPS